MPCLGIAAAFSGTSGKKEKFEPFLDTGQATKKEKDKNVANFIELTGTFLPFHEISATQRAPFHYLPSLSETSSAEPVIEITGTFIPEEATSTSVPVSTMSLMSEHTEEKEIFPTTEATAVTVDETEMPRVRGTNQTYQVGRQIISLLTSLYTAPGQSAPQGLVLVCAKSRQSFSNQCQQVQLKVSLEREANHTGHSRNIMLVDVFSSQVQIKLYAPQDSPVSGRVKRVEGRLGTLVVPGLTIDGIEKIELNSESKRIPVQVQDYVEFKINDKVPGKADIELIDLRSELVNSEPLQLKSMDSSSVRYEPSLVVPVTVSSKQMRTQTVGNLQGHFSVSGSSAMNQSLHSYFSNRTIPTYSPTKIENSPLAAILTEASTSTQQIVGTSTIFGFIDFTTVVDKTLLIFTPKAKAEMSSNKVARIEPTRAVIFKDFLNPSTTLTSEQQSTEESSPLINPIFESKNAQSETSASASEPQVPSIEAISSLTALLNLDLKSPEVMQLPPLESSFPIEPSLFNQPQLPSTVSASSASGVTITSGFILPSFSSQEEPKSKVTLNTQSPLTYYTRMTEFLTEEENSQVVTKSNKITSSNVPYDNEGGIQPTKSMKTYYTTYTYYTTFKDAETQFVHSRREVVTNVVDESEMEAVQASTATGQQSTAFPASTALPSFTSPKVLVPLEASPSATEVPVDISHSSNVASSSGDMTGTGSSLNKSYLGKLLSGIAVPITHYTTFTYYTTFFKDQASQIVSRTKVVSNVVTGTINLNQAIQKRSTEYAANPQDILPEAAENLPVVITPVTEYATSVFYTTFFIPGQGSTVVSNTQTLSKVYLPEFSQTTRPRQTSKLPVASKPSSFGRLTADADITRLINGLPVLANGDISLPTVETTSRAAPILEEAEAELITPTSTRRRVVITRTRTLPNAHSLDGFPRKSTVVVRGPPKVLSDTSSSSVLVDPHDHQLGRIHPSVTPSPVTFYTTYTYFTTELVNGSPVVRSNQHLFSTVITGKILPTRVLPTLHQRIKRTAVLEMQAKELVESLQETPTEEIAENKIDLSKSSNSLNDRPTGVVSEVVNKSGLHTVVTQIIGTLINGFYAQFAVTKTLEPKMMLSTVENIETNNLVDQSESQLEVTTETPDIQEWTEGETTTVPSETTTELDLQFPVEVTTPVDIITEPSLLIMNELPPNSTLGSNQTESPLVANLSDTTASSIQLEEKSTETVIPSSQSLPASSNSSSTTNLSATTATTESSLATQMLSSIVNSANSTSNNLQQPSFSVSVELAPSLSESSSSQTFSIDYRTGLISSYVDSQTIGSQVTRITREVYGTYIAGIYAHLAKSRSDTIELTSQTGSSIVTSVQPLIAPTSSAVLLLQSSSAVPSFSHETSKLVSSSTLSTFLSSSQTESVSAGVSSKRTSLLETEVSPTVSSSVPQVSMESVTSVLSTSSWITLPGLSSVLLTTETLNQTILVHTTEYYTTEINGFTAHYSRSTSSVAGTIEPTSTLSSRRSIHFPTPVRFLFSTKSSQLLNSIYTAPSDAIEPPRSSRKYKELYGDENDYYDETFALSGNHMPRSRIIREKDSQPVVEYAEYDVDYADNSEQSIPPESPRPTPSYTSEHTSTFSYGNQRAQQQARAYNSLSYAPRRSAGFGARVKAGQSRAEEQSLPSTSQRLNEENQALVQPRGRQTSPRVAPSAGLANRRRQMARTSSITASRSLDYYNIHDYSSTRGSYHLNPNEIRQETRGNSEAVNSRSVSRQTPAMQSDSRGSLGRQRQLNRQRSRYSTTTSTTTTTPAPRNYALLPSQRLRLNRKYNNRNRQQEATNVRVQTVDPDLNRERSEVHKERVRYRGPSKARQYGQTMRAHTAKETQEMYQASSVYATPAIPQLPITVTSIITTVRTVPIFHGFRTSYATLTTTTLKESVIPHSLYETAVNKDGLTKTLFTKMTNPSEPHKVTEILVTTSALQEVKLVPIKFGYSTRTETLTDIKTFTMLTTVVHTRSQELQLPPPGSSLLTTVSTYVTTQTLSSTSAVSLLLHGKTLVSTLTFTSVMEATLTKTETLTVPTNQASQIQPQSLVTLLTLSLTGDNGEVTELVTAITVPVQQMVHTKVERDVKATSSFSLDELDRHRLSHSRILLESSTSPLPQNTHLSASFKTVEQYSETHPFFITTLFKGPNTEVYEAQATKMSHDSEGNSEEAPLVFRKRRLQQFNDNLYKESTGMAVGAEHSFNSERTSLASSSLRKPSFQRVRIKSRPNTRNNEHKSQSETRLHEFNRLVGMSEVNFAASPSANSFRRVPISREPTNNVYSSSPSSVYAYPTSSATYLLANNFQKPTFRKIKPTNNRRIVSSIRTMQPIIVSSVIQPSQVFASPLVHSYNSNFQEIVSPKNPKPNSYRQTAAPPQVSHLRPELPYFRPDHRPQSNANSRNRFNSVAGLDVFGPNGSNRHEFNDNTLGSLRLPTEGDELSTSQPALDSSVHTPTIPLTYYTTFTYLTTVIRGPHTAHLSRESVTSAITTKALDKRYVFIK